jgi:hypothetical protein
MAFGRARQGHGRPEVKHRATFVGVLPVAYIGFLDAPLGRLRIWHDPGAG